MSKKKKQSSASAAGTSENSEKAVEKVNLLAEDAGPRSDKMPIPMGLVILFSILIFVCDLHLLANRGGFDNQVYQPYASVEQLQDEWPVDPVVESRRNGMKVYATCAACHMGNGLGQPNQFPPLAGSDWVMEEGPNRIIRLVLHGMSGPITVNGQSFNNQMPPWGDTFTDQQIADVITFIRSEWGNKASAVTPDQVAKVRSEGARGPWAPDDLLKTSAK